MTQSSRSQKRRDLFWPILLAGVIVFASSRSQVASPDIPDFDKVAHTMVYGLLGTLVARNGFLPRRAWLAIVLVSLFGITDEWHQSFTPGRSVEFADWLADTFGAALAVTLYARWGLYHRVLEMQLRKPFTPRKQS